MRKYKDFEQAFTLLELLIVCLLISISLAVTIPSLKLPGLTDALGSDARKIISIVREVKSKAIADQQPYLLHFDTVGNTIWFEKEKADQEQKKQNEETPGDEKGAILTLSETVRIEDLLTLPEKKSDSSEVILWVSEQGYTKQTVIQLSNDDGEYLSIELAPFVTEIKLHETLFTLN